MTRGGAGTDRLSRIRVWHPIATFGILRVATFWIRNARMTDDTPAAYGVNAPELTVSKGGNSIAELPAGVLAKAWLDQYSRQLTWIALRKWLLETSCNGAS
jgi:hypothetical protein